MEIKGNWIIEKSIGSGGFGHVHKVHNRSTHKRAALKSCDESDIKYIKHEAKIMELLEGEPGFPRMIEYTYDYLVMSLLGERLYSDTDIDIGYVATQMLNRIKALHEYGYVHNDIKLSNFVFGRHNNDETIYLIDFGLSERYRYDGHREKRHREGFRGTLTMASPYVLRGIIPSRRDDLISLGYCIIRFYKNLPWKNSKLSKTRLATVKMDIITLTEDLPEPLSKYMNIVMNLKYNMRPPYKQLKSLLNTL